MNTDIDILALALLAAKQKIAAAQAEYDHLLGQWLAIAPTKNEGSVQSVGSQYRITTTYGMNRSVDGPALWAEWPRLPEGVRNVFPVKHGIDLKELRHWQNNNPDEYARYIAPFITAKPAKPQVKVEALGAMKEVA